MINPAYLKNSAFIKKIQLIFYRLHSNCISTIFTYNILSTIFCILPANRYLLCFLFKSIRFWFQFRYFYTIFTIILLCIIVFCFLTNPLFIKIIFHTVNYFYAILISLSSVFRKIVCCPLYTMPTNLNNPFLTEIICFALYLN